MGETYQDSINKTFNNLSRNTPVALVVGAAGFLGSHIVDQLLLKNIQVIGVDNLTTGSRDHLKEATKNKNFHFLEMSAQNMNSVNTPRLDYIFFVAGGGWNIKPILEIAKYFKSKIVFPSFIELYDSQINNHLRWYKEAEAQLANFSHHNKLNTRVVRLASLYGPRMHFQGKDSTIRLIEAALTNNLQKESVAMDFSSRAVYVSDAVELIIKSVLSGATASKIFDGARSIPIKVAEIKQVLLDPIWHEMRGFKPSDLPPWSTPNLEKTMKLLSWYPKTDLVESLKKTLNYFKENEISIPTRDEEDKWSAKAWEEEKSKRLGQTEEVMKHPKQMETKEVTKSKIKIIPIFNRNFMLTILGLMVIFYAIFYPIISLSWGIFNFRYHYNESFKYLEVGQFNLGLKEVNQASEGVEQIKNLIKSVEILKKVNILTNEFNKAEQWIIISDDITQGSRHSILGSKNLNSYLNYLLSGRGDSAGDLNATQLELDTAETNLTKAFVSLESIGAELFLPSMLLSRVENLKKGVNLYTDLTNKNKTLLLFLPDQTPKKYLLVLLDSNELRPSGGVIKIVSLLSFQGGKLKNIETKGVSEIDKLLPAVEPPLEIKEDLGLSNWTLKDAFIDPDYPTSARQVEWFFSKVSSRIDGVISYDFYAIWDLLLEIGPVGISEYGEITSDNLFEKLVTYANNEKFLIILQKQLLDKIISQDSFNQIIESLAGSAEKKHLLVYVTNPQQFSYLVSQELAGAIPRQAANNETGKTDDLLAQIEANFGSNWANFYVDRSIKLETNITKLGEINHRLRVSFINRSLTNTWPQGKYKNRLKFYLPYGTKLSKVTWGQIDVTNSISSFSDYGRTVYSLLLELGPKEQKVLMVDYSLSNKLIFQNGMAFYKLDIIKQAGTKADPLEWKLSYPETFKLMGQTGSDQIIYTDLSRNRSFEAKFTKD